MQTNRLLSATTVSLLSIAGVLGGVGPATAAVTYDNTIAPIVGSGNSSGGWTTATDNGLALSLRAQYNNTVSPLPSNLTPNDGAGTFTFGTGTATAAVWDFWFDVNPGSTSTSGDTYLLSISSSLGGLPVLVPIGLIPDNGHSGTEFQNSEDIGFSFIGYNPSQVATYYFTLTADDSNGNALDTATMTVNNGSAPVPEPATITAAALLLLPLGVGALRQLRKLRAA
ncbi:MAG: hypothetical protein ABSH48_13400 [Verrucomicrobiota bacterium]|jgi:hypothetical protein